MNNKITSTIFYESAYLAIELLQDNNLKLEAYQGLLKYGLYGEVPNSNNPMINMIYAQAIPLMKINKEKYYKSINKNNNFIFNFPSSPYQKVGIYSITIDTEEGHLIYYGESLDIDKRIKQHIEQLQNHTHYNDQLQSLYNMNCKFYINIIEAEQYIPRHNTFYKIFNLIKEQSYIEKDSNWFCVLNKERSFDKLKSDINFQNLLNEFYSYNIKTYKDIEVLPEEPDSLWECFKKEFYNNY